MSRATLRRRPPDRLPHPVTAPAALVGPTPAFVGNRPPTPAPRGTVRPSPRVDSFELFRPDRNGCGVDTYARSGGSPTPHPLARRFAAANGDRS